MKTGVAQQKWPLVASQPFAESMQTVANQNGAR